MIRRLCTGDKVCCAVLTWDNTMEDIAVLDEGGYAYSIDDDGDLYLRHVDDEGTMVVTYGLLIEKGERVVLTPLGWDRWKPEYEELL